MDNEWKKPRTVFAFMFYFLFCFIISCGLSVPPELNTIISSLLGFYFGNKSAKRVKDNGEKNS